MAKKYIIVNIGSTSKKYALWTDAGELVNFRMSIDQDNKISSTFSTKDGKESSVVNEEEYKSGILFFMSKLEGGRFMSPLEKPTAIAIRVVSPGNFFAKTQEIDVAYIEKLEKAKSSAPLHITPTLEEIRKIKSRIVQVPLYGISDSEFHQTLDKFNKTYALPKDMRENIERFGYHGISVSSCVETIKKSLGSLPKNIIVCHMGGGTSITAVKDGKSFDTSMGFSPLSGMPMATRSGNIDSGALIEIIKKSGTSIEDLEIILNKKSGLLGLSGKSGDTRELLRLEENGDKDARFALDFYAHSIKKYIGSYYATLGGLNLLVFTGAIGLGSPVIRSKVLDGLSHLGLAYDADKNKIESPKISFIENSESKIKIATVPVNEMREMFTILVRIS